MKYKFRFFLLCLCGLIFGCATKTYVQPEAANLDDGEFAEIFLPDPIHYGAVLEEVDGQWRGVGIFNRFKLAPGKRCLTFALNRTFLDGKGKLIRCFKAEKGVVYTVYVDINREEKTWNVFILDYKSKSPIESLPSEDT